MRRILVIRMSAIGDVAMVCAALRQAAQTYPDRHYTLLTRPKMEALVQRLPSNVHFLAYGSTIDWKQYDMVIDAHSVWRSWGMDIRALLHGVRVRKLCKKRVRRWLITHGHMVTMPTMLTRYAQLLDLPQLTAPATDTAVVRKHIGIAPFAAHKGKIYPTERMERIVAQLAQVMAQKNENILLFGGGEQEMAILQQWEQRYPNVISLAGKHSMSEELDIMASLRWMLTMDSANMHLASFVGTRVISLWGATSPKTGFIGLGQSMEDCLRLPLPCRPCSVYGRRNCKFKDFHCLNITEQMIIQHVLTALDL